RGADARRRGARAGARRVRRYHRPPRPSAILTAGVDQLDTTSEQRLPRHAIANVDKLPGGRGVQRLESRLKAGFAEQANPFSEQHGEDVDEHLVEEPLPQTLAHDVRAEHEQV